jgi:hypothetical protein
MSDDLPLNAARRTFEWYEELIPLRGCSFNLDDVRVAYRELSVLNRSFVKEEIDKLIKDENTPDEEWMAKKANWLDNASRLTITIHGERDQRIYAEDESIFSSGELPTTVTRIYFNNITAWRRNANNTDPFNQIEITLDFNKPPLFDSETFVSSPTPNHSMVNVKAKDVQYVRTVQQIVSRQLSSKTTWYSFIHRSFAYDFGLWVLFLPLALILTTSYMNKWLPIGGPLATYRWAFFLYGIGLITVLYRFLNSYTKWAFPVNVLSHNRDKAWQHRFVISGAVVWFIQQSASTVWTLLTGQ